MENLNTTPLPRIGDKAPSFEAVTTQGPIRFPEDYAGRWIILFSHPSDFTPVCTSEFMTFAARSDEFEALNCQLVGLSVDGLYSHIAWLRTIRDKIVYRGMQHVEVRFPLIADLRMKVANLYGMIQPGESSTSAVRAVFFIDPDATIRAVIYYPLALGRNFDEIKRVLVGLQTVDRFNVALPADWHPGDEAIVPTASSSAAAEERMTRPDEGTQCYDWFFCTRPLHRSWKSSPRSTPAKWISTRSTSTANRSWPQPSACAPSPRCSSSPPGECRRWLPGHCPRRRCAKPSASCCSNSPPPSPDPAAKRQRRGVTDVTPLRVCRRIPPLRTYI